MFDTFFILFILINTMIPRHSLWQLGYHAHQYEKKHSEGKICHIWTIVLLYILSTNATYDIVAILDNQNSCQKVTFIEKFDKNLFLFILKK